MVTPYEMELQKNRDKVREKNRSSYHSSDQRSSGYGHDPFENGPRAWTPSFLRKTEADPALDINKNKPIKEDFEDRPGEHSYMTFPGQPGPNYPPPGHGKDKNFRPGMSPGPAHGLGMYPLYYRPPVDPFGASAMTFGVVSMCIFWLSIIPDIIGTILFFVLLALTGLGITLGFYAFGVKRPRSIHGLVGAILSIIAIILSTILWGYSHYMFYY